MCVFDDTYYKITTTNYISKTFLYITFPMYPWGPWPLKILMFALLVTREIATYSWPWEKTEDNKYMLGLLLILISKSWGCLPPGPGMLFLDSDTCAEGGGLFISAWVFFPVWCHPWMDDGMDWWKASWKTTTTSFIICNWRACSSCRNHFWIAKEKEYWKNS